jgi:DNA polymerase-3 subunit alpha
MQAAQILAGYSLGDADLLRRAMGKKVQAEMDAQRQRFVDGCKEVSGIDKAKANELFDLIDKFAGIRLQQEPRRRLCAARLPDRLAEDALPARILRRLDVLRHAPVGKAGGVRRRHAPQGHSNAKGRTSTAARPNSRSSRRTRAMPCAMRWRASATSAKRRWTRSWPSVRPMAVRQPGRPVPPRPARRDEPPRSWKGLPRGRVRRPGAQSRQGAGQCRHAAGRRGRGGAQPLQRAGTGCSAARTTPPRRCAWPRSSPGPSPSRWRRSARISASTSPPIRWSSGARSPRPTARAPCQPDGNRGAGRRACQAVMAAMVEGVQRRKTKRGNDFVIADFPTIPASSPPRASRNRWSSSLLRWAKDGTCVLLNGRTRQRPAPTSRRASRCAAQTARSEVKSAARDAAQA